MARLILITLFIFPFLGSSFLAAQQLIGDAMTPNHVVVLPPAAFSCGIDGALEALYAQFPERQAAQMKMEDDIYSLFSGEKSEKKGFTSPFTIPTVVHIIHNGGPENISDLQVLNALSHLNDAFAHAGYFANAGDGTDTGIRFCLARQTPDGLPATGITRHQSALTNMTMETEDLLLKGIVQWDPTRYVNIWVVSSITSNALGPGVAGYAYFPASHGQPEDGMVCESPFFGTSPDQDAVLIHEMGHYFGLYHTFQGGCPNNDCLLDGDRVCDTPPDQAQHTACPFNSCSTDADASAPNPFSTDVNDMTENFMDYSPFDCYYRFTDGQKERMQASLTMVRESLLSSNGCQDPCDPIITAAFNIDPPDGVPAGTTVNFIDQSVNASGYQWWVNGVLYSTAANPSYTFNFPGFNTVKLIVTNGPQGCLDSTLINYAVTCPVKAEFTADKTVLSPGESVLFTSNSTGNLQWFVNGVASGNNPTLLFTFPNAGVYTITLQVSNAVCMDEYALVVEVTNPCKPYGAQIRYNFANNEWGYANDMQLLFDGTTVVCGMINNKAWAAQWNAQGDVLWSISTNTDMKMWYDVRQMPDGTFILLGSWMNGVPSLTQVDKAGNIIKSWTFTLPDISELLYLDHLRKHLVVEPDGTVVLTIPYGTNLLYVVKLKLDGTVIWSKKYDNVAYGDWLKPGDGGSGYLLSRSMAFNGVNYEVFRLDDDGNMIEGYGYQPAIPINWIAPNSPKLMATSNGGFSFASTIYDQPTFRVNLVRCDIHGNIQWSNLYNSPSVTSPRLDQNYFPGKGWLLTDQDETSPNQPAIQMMRIEESGALRWVQKFNSSLSFTGSATRWAAEQAGRIHFLNLSYGNSFFLNGVIPDQTGAADCFNEPTPAEIQTNQETYTPVPPQPLVSSDITPVIENIFPVLLNAPLNKTIECAPLELPCPEICDNQNDDDGDGYIDCYDSDCPCFSGNDCISSIPLSKGISGRLAWQTPMDTVNWAATPIVANLNPQTDSIPEIILPGNTSTFTAPAYNLIIFRGDGLNAGNPDVLNIPPGFGRGILTFPAIADIDKDGLPELILVEADLKVRVYRNYTPGANPCMQLWITSDLPVFKAQNRALLADFDEDGTPEVYVGNDVFRFDFTTPGNPQLLKVLDGTGPYGQLVFGGGVVTICAPIAADVLSPSDCNGDPDCNGLELVAGSVIYSIDLDLLDGDGYQIKVAKSLNDLAPAYTWSDGFTAVADADLDGTPDILVTGDRTKSFVTERGLYIWNKNGLVRFMAPVTTFGGFGGLPSIANVYDDTKNGFSKDLPEIIVVSENQLNCFNLNASTQNPAQPYWWSQLTTDGSGFTGSSIFDFNGDGTQEIVYRDQSDLRIIYGGNLPLPPGVDAERNWWKSTVGSVTGDEFPVVADLDNDGQAEIAVTGSLVPFISGSPSLIPSRLRVYESATLPWMPCRPIWNQFSYNPLFINDDLTVPAHQQAHWKEFPGPGGGKWPYNTHLAQLSKLNSQFEPGLSVPDASAVIDSFFCQNNTLQIKLHVCNTGSAVLPDSTPVQFYSGDPANSNATPLGAPVYLSGALPKDSCRIWDLQLPMPPQGAVWGVVNDNGTIPAPFNLISQFPSTNQLECHYENNLFSIQVDFSTPDLNLGPDQVLCNSSVLPLHAGPGFGRYRWNDGSTDSLYTAYGPGKYWVDAWDICGNQFTDTLNITLNALSIELGTDLEICPGDSISLSVTGFDAYSWEPAAVISCTDCPLISLFPVAEVTLRVTGKSGNCFVTDSVQVHLRTSPELSDSVLKPLQCYGESTGQISVTLSGGNPPYAYAWSNGSNTGNTISNLSAGTYSLSVTDANGCALERQFILLPGSSPELADSVLSPIPCLDENSGQISVTLSGGNPPYAYAWSNGSNTGNTISNLSAGTYSLSVTDANGCVLERQFTLLPGSSPQLTDSVLTPILCLNENSGQISVNLSGGNPPYAYAWSNGSNTGNTVSNLSAGTYSLSVTDANGCALERQFILLPGSSPQLTDSVLTPILCLNETSGQISVTLSGGNPPYVYAWSSGGSIGNTISNLSAGTYSLSVTDANSCKLERKFILLPGSSPELTDSVLSPILCLDENSGQISVTINSGNPPYAYAWSNGGSTGNAISNLSAGTYSLSVTDANSCILERQFTLLPGSSPELTDSVLTPILCFGENTGRISVTLSGGNQPYTYAWSNGGSSGNTISNLSSGIYKLSVTDVHGCLLERQFILDEPDLLLLNIITVPDTCSQNHGMTDLTASGGNPPYQFLWSNGYSTEDIHQLSAGTWAVTVTDVNGCLTTAEAVVEPVQIPPVFDLAGGTLNCWQMETAIAVSPINSAWSYQWLLPGGDTLFGAIQTISQAGTFQAIVRNQFGCLEQKSIFITADTIAPEVVLPVSAIEIPCDQPEVLLDGTLAAVDPSWELHWLLKLNGQIEWDTMALQVGVNQPGTYILQAIDGVNGCVGMDSVTLRPAIQIEALNGRTDSVRCSGEIDGRIIVDPPQGGTAPYTFSLDNQHFSSDTVFSNLAAGAYTVYVRDAAGCQAEQVFTIGELDSLVVSLTASDTLVLKGTEVALEAFILPPGTILTNIEWAPAGQFSMQDQLNQSVQVNDNRIYRIYVENDRGCTAEASREIRVKPAGQVFFPTVMGFTLPGNDSFTAYTNNDVLLVKRLQVFDRWGNLLFDRRNFPPNDASAGWNGEFRGKKVAPGVYVFAATLQFSNGEEAIYSGDVTVIR